jgi:hypothetical protein
MHRIDPAASGPRLHSQARGSSQAQPAQAQPTQALRRSSLKALAGVLLAPAYAFAQSKGIKPMSTIAKGTFTVEMKPLAERNADGVNMGRMSLDKRFEGNLVATGTGEMLTALTPVKGSAGYVAIERITGTLAGRTGSFVFQHSGTMDRGTQRLSITVVPGSGTGALAGISGEFRLNIVEGKHFYEFEYSLP